MGVEPGDRVVVVLPSAAEFVVTCFATWKARAIVVPEGSAIRSTNLLHVLRQSTPTVLVVDSSVITRLAEVADSLPTLKAILVTGHPSIPSTLTALQVASLTALIETESHHPVALPRGAEADDTVSIMFTSGSTGTPKGVLHSHRSWLAGAIFTRDYLQVTADDKVVVPLPLHHAYAFRHLMASILAGATVMVVDHIYKALVLLRVQQPTALVLVPTACNIILEHLPSLLGEADPHLRYLEIGTAAMSPERFQRLRELLPTTAIHLSYGLTEARVGYLQPSQDGLLNCIAHTAPGLELWVQNSTDTSIAAGYPGEIVLRGNGLMQGYWGDTDAEQRQLRVDGFYTGDLGRLNEHGKVELLGRMDDMLKIGGRKVIPLEVEMTLNRHPAVLESAVVGLPDPRGLLEWQLHAFVVVKEGRTVTAADLSAHCQRSLEPYKHPTIIHFRSSLPKSPVGKVQRHVLAAEPAAGVSSYQEENHASPD
jgi:acyl-coenzyme A synthetase/AMP-(fatty) acid ligase